MTRVAVVSYDLADPLDKREVLLWMGLDDVIAELVCDHDVTREAIADRVDDAIQAAFDDKVQADD